MGESKTSEATRYLHEMVQGDASAADRLLPLVYDEVRGLAARALRHERDDHTLQPTALVHEAYLKLTGTRGAQARTPEGKEHFFAVAAQAMRRILVDHARARGRAKRGGDHVRITLQGLAELAPEDPPELGRLEAALEKLERLDARQARIVELRFFGGLDVREVARALGVSKRTVEADWTMARAWLARELERESG